jgi:hypothetical protein
MFHVEQYKYDSKEAKEATKKVEEVGHEWHE